MLENNEKTIYLHIGLHKTGTTAIQNFLFFNKEKLQEHGIFYPTIGGNIINLRPFFLIPYASVEEREMQFDDLFVKQIRYFKGNKIVLSEEDLSTYSDNRVILQQKSGD